MSLGDAARRVMSEQRILRRFEALDTMRKQRDQNRAIGSRRAEPGAALHREPWDLQRTVEAVASEVGLDPHATRVKTAGLPVLDKIADDPLLVGTGSAIKPVGDLSKRDHDQRHYSWQMSPVSHLRAAAPGTLGHNTTTARRKPYLVHVESQPSQRRHWFGSRNKSPTGKEHRDGTPPRRRRSLSALIQDSPLGRSPLIRALSGSRRDPTASSTGYGDKHSRWAAAVATVRGDQNPTAAAATDIDSSPSSTGSRSPPSRRAFASKRSGTRRASLFGRAAKPRTQNATRSYADALDDFMHVREG